MDSYESAPQNLPCSRSATKDQWLRFLFSLDTMPENRFTPAHRLILAALLVGLGVGCSSQFYKRSADREVFGILWKKSRKVPNADDSLMDITPPGPLSLAALEKNFTTVDFLGDRAKIEKNARLLPLAEALDFAIHRNRTYLTRKEQVYLSALGLTLTRQRFGPILDAGGAATYSEAQVHNGVNNFVRTSTLTATGGATLDYLMKTGTRLALDLTTDFTRFFTGGVRRVSDSQAAVTLIQPLLRGAGVLAASEPLRQDERDVLYDIRDFTQYRKTFVVDIATRYYRVLQAREASRNRYSALVAQRSNILRERDMAEAGQSTKSSLARLEQSLITYERGWINSIRSYEEALDDLKILLGVPVNERILLDTKELKRLSLVHPSGALDQAMDTALYTRLDLFNERDRVQDTVRRSKIALQNTLPTVDALAGYQMSTPGPNNRGFELNPKERRFYGGVDIDLNLNVKPERNELRAAQIGEQRALRQLELAEEEVRDQIRTDWRNLEVASKQYELAQRGLSLSESRLEIEEALTQEGQGRAIDLVDAQDDLIAARDLVISTQIDHTIARLQLWRDMGILYIEKDGSWANVLKKEKPDGQ